MIQAYTYGICGPLKLLPSAAVIIDQSYNGGFMAGRIVSIFVAKVKILKSNHKTHFFIYKVLRWILSFLSTIQIIRPRNMILLSLVTCVGSSIVLVAIGGETKYGLYAGTGIFIFWYELQIGTK